MEEVTYTYEIVSVDEAARCMEVVYTSEGHQTMHIGARLPFEGETLESVIAMFAPVQLWIEQATPVVTPSVGVAGSVSVQLNASTSSSSELVLTRPNEFVIPIDMAVGA